MMLIIESSVHENGLITHSVSEYEIYKLLIAVKNCTKIW